MKRLLKWLGFLKDYPPPKDNEKPTKEEIKTGQYFGYW